MEREQLYLTNKQIVTALKEKYLYDILHIEPKKTDKEIFDSIKIYSLSGSDYDYLSVEFNDESMKKITMQVDPSSSGKFDKKGAFFWIDGEDAGSLKETLSELEDEIIVRTYCDSLDITDIHVYDDLEDLYEDIDNEVLPYNSFINILNNDFKELKKIRNRSNE